MQPRNCISPWNYMPYYQQTENHRVNSQTRREWFFVERRAHSGKNDDYTVYVWHQMSLSPAGENIMHFWPHSLHPAPCTLHPAPCTLHPAPSTLQCSQRITCVLRMELSNTSHSCIWCKAFCGLLRILGFLGRCGRVNSITWQLFTSLDCYYLFISCLNVLGPRCVSLFPQAALLLQPDFM